MLKANHRLLSNACSRIAAIKLAVTFSFVIAGVFVFGINLVKGTVEAAINHPDTVFKPSVPRGIPESLWRKYIPADNPMTAEKVALGEALYSDKRLSIDGTVSCATCHDPALAFTDLNPVAIGFKGRHGTRNAPSILNAMFSDALFWDGRAGSLEEQVKQPLVNPVEMGMESHEKVVVRVASILEYQQRFLKVFGKDGITIDNIARAIAAFERTQLSGNSPFDRFMAGDKDALTEAQKRGWDIFRNKAQCITCHSFTPSSPFFTDFKFHNTGVATDGRNFEVLAQRAHQTGAAGTEQGSNLISPIEGFSELGRFLVTRQPKDIGAFKTPTLRDIELTAPYMHDGSIKTLFDIVKFYNRGGEKNPYLDERMSALKLTEQEMNDLVEFLRSLTSDDVLRRAQSLKPQTRTPVQISATESR